MGAGYLRESLRKRKERLGDRERFVVECYWSGDLQCEENICHRQTTFVPHVFQRINGIHFEDGKVMIVVVRKALHKEHVVEFNEHGPLLLRIIKARLSGEVYVKELAKHESS